MAPAMKYSSVTGTREFYHIERANPARLWFLRRFPSECWLNRRGCQAEPPPGSPARNLRFEDDFHLGFDLCGLCPRERESNLLGTADSRLIPLDVGQRAIYSSGAHSPTAAIFYPGFLEADTDMDVKSTWLFLVRHGATTANEQVPYILQGNGIDLPLSPNGERQAEAVANFLPRFPIRRVYSSAMLRARQTAARIAAQLQVETAAIPELHECSVGRWEGLDWETIRQLHPEDYRRFHENPAEHPYLGGESYGDVLRRTKPVLEGLVERHAGEAIAVVAHNVVNRTFLADLMGLDLRRAPRIMQANCCVNIIRMQGNKRELMTLNGAFHLGDDYFRDPPLP
jgi:broad specificity phosphatase PhoE